MLKDSDYKLAHSHESYYNHMPIGVRIFIASGRDTLTDLERRAARRGSQDVFNAIFKQHVLLDEDAKAYAAKEKAEILKLFEGKSIFVQEIPNGYGGEDPYYAVYPWFIVTTPIGHIKIGWRKRVINIDWTNTLQKKKAEELFPNEDVTKSGEYDEIRYIHAWGYEKAKEYLDIIHKDVPLC